LIPEYLKGLFQRLRPQKKPVFSQVKVDYIYSHFRGQNHVRKGGRKKICHTHLSIMMLNRSDARYILQELTLWVKIGGQTYRFRLYDNECGKWDVPYTLEPHTIYSFSYNAVPVGFRVWPGHYDGTLPFRSKDKMLFYITYRTERGQTQEVTVDNVRKVRFNTGQIVD
jgi:hypothetical protein